ncbi:response regulator [Roseomonas elaeocarpi]|uniref:Response regulator n=1 Tax=Roseomonas elaeocarpi TaxID=907779 RepID=A0ABV6JPR0_9PROT
MATAGPLTGRRILVLEDEYIIAVEMESWLSEAGAAVIGPFARADEALAALADGKAAVDAGVLDINLGRGGTAYPVAARMDALGVPYVFATGNNLEADDPSFRGRPRLEKPVSARSLIRMVSELVS